MILKEPARGAICVAAVALLANTLALLGTNPKNAGDSDGPFYSGIARSLASGKGYYLPPQVTFWPDLPTMGRAPVWPAIVAVPALLFPGASDFTLLRVTAACLNTASAAMFFAIAWLLSGDRRRSLAAGICYALYPVALALTAGGFSEIPYVFVMALGLLMILRGGRLLYLGALILGLGALVRSNFILLPAGVALAALFQRRKPLSARTFALLAVLFWLPAGLWILRNYALSGDFPVLSTIEGETLYGGNNAYVASTLSDWGYWVFPNDIPGETPKQELARSMTERQLDRYYHKKGMDFLKANWFALPRLEVGKLIRAFVPVPWVAGWASYAVFFTRALFYVAILLTLPVLRKLDATYGAIVMGMFVVTLVTVLIYYGTYRFTFCTEVFLFPAVAIGFARHYSTWPDRHQSS